MNIKNTNKSRVQKLKSKLYDPLKGIGSPLERIKLFATPESTYHLIPKKMADDDPFTRELLKAKSVAHFARNRKISKGKIEAMIAKQRMKYDFEFWAVSCVKIQDKQTKRTIPFIMRSAQQKLFALLITELYANRPIRVILLKARQWGGSTLIQLFMAWIQLFHRKSWHSVIVADVEEQSRNIRAMYSRLAKGHPPEVFPIELKNFEGSTKSKVIEGREAIIYIGSMQKPDSLRSSDVMMAHLTEVGLWRATEGKQPEDVVQSIAGTVPLEPYSVIVMESTAKGVGNFFHRGWQAAVSGTNGYLPLFVAWFEIDIYSRPFADEKECDEFITSLTPYEHTLFELGATLEAIHWYRTKKHTDGYSDWRMGCEFPSTPQEAFQSTGRRAHSPDYVKGMREFCCEPLYKGEIFANAHSGKAAIDNSVNFVACAGGEFWVWKLPDSTTPTPMRNRYVVSMDIGGRTPTADWSVISVIDRLPTLSGSVEECIATYRFHLDQDLAVWRAVQVAVFYNRAHLVVEANSLNSQSTDGDHTLTVLDQIKGVYRNLFCRTDPQQVVEGRPARYGFFTSRSSKTDLVNQMNRRMRERSYVEYDSRALDEADLYELKEDGTYGAVIGEHDDIYMSRAIGLKVCDLL